MCRYVHTYVDLEKWRNSKYYMNIFEKCPRHWKKSETKTEHANLWYVWQIFRHYSHTHTYIHKIYSTFELYYIYSHDCFDVVGCLETRFIFIPKDSQSKKQKKTKNTMK